MAVVELIMPKMGESIIEATILKWNKKPGDSVDADETILEVATDKVDSEVPSPVKGILKEIKFSENAVVPIGALIALIDTGGDNSAPKASPAITEKPVDPIAVPASSNTNPPTQSTNSTNPIKSSDNRFYSPLVKNIAKQEGLSQSVLDNITGTGQNGRVTKRDIVSFLQSGNNPASISSTSLSPSQLSSTSASPSKSFSGNTEIIEMDRMRKLIADHMVMSKQTSPHVTSFIEVDVTGMVKWREKHKDAFQKKHGQKITFTPLFMHAVSRALLDYPMVNVSVDGTKIILKKDINIGMAAALPSGNLIVPVIKNADRLNLVGLTFAVNDLAERSRANKLKPEEIQDGTFTMTNVGTFGNLMGTPIINQPQAAILATGSIVKKPAVIETPDGDFIGIRQMMFLSLSYDHRIVDGALGGSFLKRIGDYLETFDPQTSY